MSSWTNTVNPNIGTARYNVTPPTATDGDLVEAQSTAAGLLRVVVEGSTWPRPTSYTVVGDWPAAPSTIAIMNVTSAPAAAATMPATATWVVANTTASAITVGAHTVAAKRAELLQTDSLGTITSYAICVVD